MAWRISFHAIGDDFSPAKMNFRFHEQNEKNEIHLIGIFKGEEYGYGSASYYVPEKIERLKKFKHLADTFEPLLDELKKCGAESWHIELERLYYAQCNEELDFNEIVEIQRLKCSFCYSAYSVSENEEKEGFNQI